jgi:hypothetical protein
MKYLLILILLVGCKSYNESLYIQVNKGCPKICENNKGWSEFLRSTPELLYCVCNDYLENK